MPKEDERDIFERDIRAADLKDRIDRNRELRRKICKAYFKAEALGISGINSIFEAIMKFYPMQSIQVVTSVVALILPVVDNLCKEFKPK